MNIYKQPVQWVSKELIVASWSPTLRLAHCNRSSSRFTFVPLSSNGCAFYCILLARSHTMLVSFILSIYAILSSRPSGTTDYIVYENSARVSQHSVAEWRIKSPTASLRLWDFCFCVVSLHFKQYHLFFFIGWIFFFYWVVGFVLLNASNLFTIFYDEDREYRERLGQSKSLKPLLWEARPIPHLLPGPKIWAVIPSGRIL